MGEQAAARELFGMRTHPETGGIAQLGEHLPCKQGVTSSSLVISTRRSEGEIKAVSPLRCAASGRDCKRGMASSLANDCFCRIGRDEVSEKGERPVSTSEPHVTEHTKCAKVTNNPPHPVP